MPKPAVSLQPASHLSPPLSPPPQHLVGLQPAIILALTHLVTRQHQERVPHHDSGSWACFAFRSAAAAAAYCCLLLSNDGALQLGQVRSGFARLQPLWLAPWSTGERPRGTAAGRENPKSRDVLARTNKQHTRPQFLPPATGAGRVNEPGRQASINSPCLSGIEHPMEEPRFVFGVWVSRAWGERARKNRHNGSRL